jgi:hypothetical protein
MCSPPPIFSQFTPSNAVGTGGHGSGGNGNGKEIMGFGGGNRWTLDMFEKEMRRKETRKMGDARRRPR